MPSKNTGFDSSRLISGIKETIGQLTPVILRGREGRIEMSSINPRSVATEAASQVKQHENLLKVMIDHNNVGIFDEVTMLNMTNEAKYLAEYNIRHGADSKYNMRTDEQRMQAAFVTTIGLLGYENGGIYQSHPVVGMKGAYDYLSNRKSDDGGVSQVETFFSVNPKSDGEISKQNDERLKTCLHIAAALGHKESIKRLADTKK